ncbi:MAG: hypothetical protein HY619_05480 [Thaumarchaeota archaeon]|nr:hypothetical protein [Nitrososphaerota archaeon]
MVPLSKKLLVSVGAAVVLLYLSTLPLITVQKIGFEGEALSSLLAFAQSPQEGNILNLQVNLQDVSFEGQGYSLNATSANITLKGLGQPDGNIDLTINLEMKNLDVKTGDSRAKIANGILSGNILVTKDNKIVADLQAKSSVLDILRSLIGL